MRRPQACVKPTLTLAQLLPSACWAAKAMLICAICVSLIRFTALAPVLFARSDTFLVRAYGEAYNPATQSAEGKAWCEALVQRLPEYVDASQPPETTR